MTTRGLPLQQHPQFGACLADQGREVLVKDDHLSLIRRLGPLSVSLVSRGSDAALQASETAKAAG